ncbi:hypothetical protein PPTG_23188 [Phytophthora nicotianae INRA-310]|uniref:Uncharacterized protein n=1 Tax=Phytophthora nicotianae (strain INRA-310) TaxID=761204 RepID=W2Q4J2_PHYN3|nr:hypothetical protein PPTG_23188 [Phytophthora nicotianae INRA-310]ETN07459.1 hypothetical protein PPTG_23188 [Phytophthora nicotianae INRA-310]
MFRAEKSSIVYLVTGNDHYPVVEINNRRGIPQPARASASLPPTWAKLCAVVERLNILGLSAAKVRYVIITSGYLAFVTVWS